MVQTPVISATKANEAQTSLASLASPLLLCLQFCFSHLGTSLGHVPRNRLRTTLRNPQPQHFHGPFANCTAKTQITLPHTATDEKRTTSLCSFLFLSVPFCSLLCSFLPFPFPQPSSWTPNPPFQHKHFSSSMRSNSTLSSSKSIQLAHHHTTCERFDCAQRVRFFHFHCLDEVECVICLPFSEQNSDTLRKQPGTSLRCNEASTNTQTRTQPGSSKPEDSGCPNCDYLQKRRGKVTHFLS